MRQLHCLFTFFFNVFILSQNTTENALGSFASAGSLFSVREIIWTFPLFKFFFLIQCIRWCDVLPDFAALLTLFICWAVVVHAIQRYIQNQLEWYQCIIAMSARASSLACSLCTCKVDLRQVQNWLEFYLFNLFTDDKSVFHSHSYRIVCFGLRIRSSVLLGCYLLIFFFLCSLCAIASFQIIFNYIAKWNFRHHNFQ